MLEFVDSHTLISALVKSVSQYGMFIHGAGTKCFGNRLYCKPLTVYVGGENK